MSTKTIKMIPKSDVATRLGICERSLEKLVKASKFPAGLRLGKQVLWADGVVEQWLLNAVAPQLNWTQPKRKRLQ